MNTRIFRSMVSLMLAILLLIGSIPSAVFAAETKAEEVLGTEVSSLSAVIEMGGLVVQHESLETVQQSVSNSATAAANAEEPDYLSVNEAVKELRRQLKNRNTDISIFIKSTDSISSDLWKSLFNRAIAHTGVPTEGDYLLYHMQKIDGHYSCTSVSGVSYAELNYSVQYHTTAAQEKTVTSRLSTVMSQLKLSSKTDAQKIKAIYDYLTENITYDFKNYQSSSRNLLKMSAYAALVNKTCVCQGYANLLYRMALEAGIDCRIITGTGNGGAHAWNIVKLGNRYYNLDATWDAQMKQADRAYEYYLKSNANFADHARDAKFKTKDFNSSYPMASSNYSSSGTSTLKSPVISVTNVSSSGKPKISWNAVKGAVKYKVYRSTSKNGTYSCLTTTTKTSLTNTSTSAGKLYYYKVKAIDANGKTSAFSSVVSRRCDLPRPTNVKARNLASTGKIKITWDAVEGAQKYEVYRSTSKNGTYSKLATVTGTSCTNTKATAGKTYYYKVRAVHSNTGANSALSSYVSRTCDLPRPDVTITRNSKGKPRLTWDAIDGAVKYEVYRSTNKNGTYSKLTTVTGTSCTNTKATAGKTYYYKVKAICRSTSANSAYSTVRSIKSK